MRCESVGGRRWFLWSIAVAVKSAGKKKHTFFEDEEEKEYQGSSSAALLTTLTFSLDLEKDGVTALSILSKNET